MKNKDITKEILEEFDKNFPNNLIIQSATKDDCNAIEMTRESFNKILSKSLSQYRNSLLEEVKNNLPEEILEIHDESRDKLAGQLEYDGKITDCPLTAYNFYRQQVIKLTEKLKNETPHTR